MAFVCHPDGYNQLQKWTEKANEEPIDESTPMYQKQFTGLTVYQCDDMPADKAVNVPERIVTEFIQLLKHMSLDRALYYLRGGSTDGERRERNLSTS